MAFDKAAAKAAGYTDEQINEYLAQNPEAAAPQKIAELGDAPPAPTTVIPPRDKFTASDAATLGIGLGHAVSEYGVPAAIGAGALYGGSKISQGIKLGREAIGEMQARTATQQAAIEAQQRHINLQEQKFNAAQARAGAIAPGPAPTGPSVPGAAPIEPIRVPQGSPWAGQPPATYNVPTGGVPNMPPQTTPPAAPAAPPIGGPAAQQGSTFIQRLAQQYAPIANVMNKAAPYLQGASRMVAPAMIAKELFYTSPEERAILQKAEDEKRAQGWKPLSERF